MATAGIIESPPYFQTNIFNTLAFESDTNLTKPEADRLYLSISAGVNLGLIDAITPGQASASKALILDANKDIIGIRNLGLTGDLTLSGGSSHIYLTGSASGIDITGNNANVSILGAGGHLILSNAEAANDTGSQGAIKCAGGIYSNANSYFGSTVQVSGVLSCLNTTDASSLTSGALTIAGGLSCAKSLYCKSQVIDHAQGGDLIDLRTTSNVARCAVKFNTDTTNWLLSARASNVSEANTFNIQNGSDYRFQMKTNGDLRLFSTSESNSTFTTGCLRLDGGLSVAKNIHCYRNVITSNGNQLTLQTGSSPTDYSALIECPGSGSLHLATTLSGVTTHMTLGKGLWISNSSVGPSRGAPLDFGSTARDVIISLYATGLDDSSVYGIGAKNSAMQFISPQSFSWINNSSSFPGDIRMYIDSSGRMALGNSTSPACAMEVSSGTVRIQSQASPASGEGLELAYDPGADTANIYSFNRSTGAYHNLNLNDTMYLSGDRYIGVRTNSPICALDVRSSVTSSTLNSFGYLSSSGSGTASGFSNRPFSIRCSSGIRCDSGEIDVISDVRLKKNITTLDDSIVERVLSLEAITFKYLLQPDEDTKRHHGFRAQDLVAKGLNCLCGFSDSDEPLEDMDIVCDDGSIAHLRGSQRLVMNLPEMIPVLQRALQIQQKKLDEQQKQIDELYSKLL